MKIKRLLFLGIVLSLIGTGICVFASTRDDFDIKKSYIDPTIEEKSINFSNIKRITYDGDADYVIFKNTEESSSFTYYEGKNLSYHIEYLEETGELTVKQEYKSGFINLGFLSKGELPIIFYLNQEISTLEFDLNAGKLTIEGLEIDHANLEINAGDMEIKDTAIDVLKAKINAGDLRYYGEVLSSADVSIDAGYLKMALSSPKDKYRINGNGEGSVNIHYDINVGSTSFTYKEE